MQHAHHVRVRLAPLLAMVEPVQVLRLLEDGHVALLVRARARVKLRVRVRVRVRVWARVRAMVRARVRVS